MDRFFNRLEEGLDTGPVRAGTLRKASVTGGPPIAICQVNGASRGASWSSDDTVIFATNDPATGILRVSASGGEPEVLTTPDPDNGERDHYFPSMLPGGNGVLFTIISRDPDGSHVAVLDLETRQQRTLIRDARQAEYVETGHLIYIAGGTLWAVGFDLVRLNIRGDPVPLVERIMATSAANFSVSRRGTLVYVPRTVGGGLDRVLVWVNRAGRDQHVAAPPRAYDFPRLSPDGDRVAVRITDQERHLWVLDLKRQTSARLTLKGPTFLAVWTPDGRSIVFNAGRPSTLFRRPTNGTGADERLTSAPRELIPTTMSPDGMRLVYQEQVVPESAYDLMLLTLQGTPRTEPLLQTALDERNAEISPNGRWLAYESNVSGRAEIYVRPFPNVNDGYYQISTGGGQTPLWAPSGKELFFISGTRMMSAAVQMDEAFTAGNPTALFDDRSLLLDGRSFTTGAHRTFDVSRDGQRFLVLKDTTPSIDDEATSASMVVVHNWFEELKARVPVGR